MRKITPVKRKVYVKITRVYLLLEKHCKPALLRDV